jgi:hypothetical protein
MKEKQNMTVKKLAVCLGFLAFAGWGNLSHAQEESAAAPTDEVTIEVLDEYHARPELDGVTPIEGFTMAEEDGIDAQRRRIRPGPRPGPRPRPGWGPGPRRPGFPFPFPFPFPQPQTVCFAQNNRGVVFRASGWGNQWQIQQEAVRVCRIQSRGPCRPLGCRR